MFRLLYLPNAWLDKETQMMIKAEIASPANAMHNFAPSDVYSGCSLAVFWTTDVQM